MMVGRLRHRCPETSGHGSFSAYIVICDSNSSPFASCAALIERVLRQLDEKGYGLGPQKTRRREVGGHYTCGQCDRFYLS